MKIIFWKTEMHLTRFFLSYASETSSK